MVQAMKRFWNNQRGVTLIELLAVVVILGIIAAIAAPSVITSFTDAKSKSDTQTEKIVIDAAQRYIVEGKTTVTANSGTTAGSATITITELVNNGYLREAPKWSTGTAVGDVTVTRDITNANKLTYSVAGKPTSY